MKHLVPRDYQRLAVDFMTAHMRCNLWAGMGMGKTVSALMAVDLLRLLGDISRPTLVLGPLRVARDVWPDEPKKWDQYAHLNVVPIVGTPTQRRRALQMRALFYSCNYEQLEWLLEALGERWPFGTVIADESTRLKGYRLVKGGVRAKALANVAHSKTDRWINLTGTPAPQGLEDLWGQQWFVDHGQRLGRSYTAFMQRWFQKEWNGYGVIPLPHADAEIKSRIKDCTLTLDPADYFDIQQPIERDIVVKLPPAARQIYKSLEDKLFAELESGNHIEVFNSGGLSNKCRQVASGGAYTKAPEWEELHDAKIEALQSIREEANGMPLLVANEFQFEREMILARFKDAVDISTPKGYKAFKSGAARLGVAHPGSMGHGVDGLQHVTNILVRYGHTWKAEDHQQMAERIGPVRQLQAGYARPVWHYNILVEKTVEYAVRGSVTSNMGAEASLRAYMKRS